MDYYLLIDFGASFIKACPLRRDNLEFLMDKTYALPAFKPITTENGCFEIDLDVIKGQFFQLLSFYANQGLDIAGVALCSQMHGFIVADEHNNPLTHYISWQDARCLNKLDGLSSIDWFRRQVSEEAFKSITGMTLTPGLPIVNFLHYCREGKFKNRRLKILSLPDWIAGLHGQSQGVSHVTMMAGLGFYDIRSSVISTELTALFKETANVTLLFNEPVDDFVYSGYLNLERKTPIVVGVGDHPCALLGAGNHYSTISINLGTGSQLSKIIPRYEEPSSLAIRPYFGKNYLLTLTHIPSGRALNEYLNFIKTIAQACNATVDVWNDLMQISTEQILASTLTFDLAIFQGAVNYNQGGKIVNIEENSLNLTHYYASLLKSYVFQYIALLKKIEWLQANQVYVLSGGIPRKLPVLKQVFEQSMLTGIFHGPSELDETLLGLKLIVEQIERCGLKKESSS